MLKVLFYIISIVSHVVIFYILALHLGVLNQFTEEKQYEVLKFQLVNPVVKNVPPPPPEVKKSLPPKIISSVTEVTDKPEEEQDAKEQVVQQITSKVKEFTAFYKVDTRPSFKNKAPQRYPLLEKRAGKEGIVIIEVDIDENGILKATRIKKSGGKNFDASALEMIQNSTYNPGMKDGVPIPVRMRFTIRYQLKN